MIKKNQKVIFFYKKKPRNIGCLSIKLSNIIPKSKNFKNSNFFSVDDGNYKFKILEYNNNYIIGKSIQNFVMEISKGINIKNSIYDSKIQEKKYFETLKIVSKLNINAIGLSYIQNEKKKIKIKKQFPKLVIVSKVENLEGLLNIDNICKFSDVIMIDRGDLSAEIGEENLFDAILKINQFSKKHGKPIIMATENLRSMINKNTPDKSEIMSLGISKMLNIDSIMLSEETATSKNWKSIINWLNNFNRKSKVKSNLFNQAQTFNNPVFDKINYMSKTDVVLFLKKGYFISDLKKIDNQKNIFVFSDNEVLLTNLQFYSNVKTFKVKKLDKNISQNFINKEIKKNKNDIFKYVKQVVMIFTSFPIRGSKANTITIINKNNFN